MLFTIVWYSAPINKALSAWPPAAAVAFADGSCIFAADSADWALGFILGADVWLDMYVKIKILEFSNGTIKQ